MSDGQVEPTSTASLSAVASATNLTNGSNNMDSTTNGGDVSASNKAADSNIVKHEQNGSDTAPTSQNNTASSLSADDDSERARALRNSHATKGNDDRWLASRVFVGNLPSDLQTDAGELYDKFRKHGPIKGISVHGRFSFIQFEQDADAERAAKAEAGALLRGSTLEVRLAKEGRRGRGGGDEGRGDRDRDRERGDGGGGKRREESSEISGGGSDRRRREDGGGGGGRRRSRSRSRSPRNRQPQRRRSRSPMRGGGSDRGGRRDDNLLPVDPVALAAGAVPLPAIISLKPPSQPNDVEIIVVRRDLADYAQFVERRCKDCNLHVDIIFLHEDAEYEDAVRDLGNRGTSCVLMIMPRHRERRAVTLYRFDRQGGQPEEHKAVPLQDALTLIMQFYKRYKPATLRQRELEARGPGFFPQAQVSDIEWALRALADRRFVPSLYIDHTIAYLATVRQVAATSEGGLVDVLGVPSAVAPLSTVAGVASLGLGAGGYGVVPLSSSVLPAAITPQPAAAAVPGLDNATLHKLIQLAQTAGITGNSSANNSAAASAVSPYQTQQQQQQPPHSTHDIQRALDSLYAPRGTSVASAGQQRADSGAYDSYRSAATSAEQARGGGGGAGISNGSAKQQYDPVQQSAGAKYDLYGRSSALLGGGGGGGANNSQSASSVAASMDARMQSSAYSAALSGQQQSLKDPYGGAARGGSYGAGGGGYGVDSQENVYVDRYGQAHSTGAGGSGGGGGYGATDKYDDKLQAQRGAQQQQQQQQQQSAYGQQQSSSLGATGNGGGGAGGYGGYRY